MKWKPFVLIILLLAGLLGGCQEAAPQAQVAATTLPVYEFTQRLCQGTGITVTRLVTESLSCLHDYSLNVHQVRAVEAARVVVLSGGGLEEAMGDFLGRAAGTIDASENLPLLICEAEADHDHHGHHHENDPHFWLSPVLAKGMVQNICAGLIREFPEFEESFLNNQAVLLSELDALQAYGLEALSTLSCRELITFHDGFSYFARSFGLTILRAVEEESGSEASAAELKEMIRLTQQHHLPAIFTETNGSSSAAQVIGAETGAAIYSLDMAMAGDSYFDAMYRNIDTIKEALG